MDFIRVFYSPLKISYDTRKWVYYFLAAIVLSYITLFLNFHYHSGEIIKAITERLSGLSPEEKEKILKMLTVKSLLIRSTIGVAFTAVFQLLFFSGIFYLILLFTGDENFSKALFASSIYSYIKAAGGMLSFLLSLIFGVFPFKTDLSIFYGGEGFIKGFLSSLDFFTIYGFIICAIILKKDDKNSRIYVIIWLFVLLVIWAVLMGIFYRLRP